MEIALTLLLSGFLLFYALNVIVGVFEKLYYISCSINEKQQEEEEKNNVPDSVKRLYS